MGPPPGGHRQKSVSSSVKRSSWSGLCLPLRVDVRFRGAIYRKIFDSQNVAFMQSDLIFYYVYNLSLPSKLQTRKPSSNTCSAWHIPSLLSLLVVLITSISPKTLKWLPFFYLFACFPVLGRITCLAVGEKIYCSAFFGSRWVVRDVVREFKEVQILYIQRVRYNISKARVLLGECFWKFSKSVGVHHSPPDTECVRKKDCLNNPIRSRRFLGNSLNWHWALSAVDWLTWMLSLPPFSLWFDGGWLPVNQKGRRSFCGGVPGCLFICFYRVICEW